MTEIWTPEDDLRRYYPHLGERLDRLPFDEIAQHALEIEREMKPGEMIELTIRRDVHAPSEASLVIDFTIHDRSIEYMLIAPGPDGPGLWMATRMR